MACDCRQDAQENDLQTSSESTLCADGKTIGNLEDMKEAAAALHAFGPQYVLVKVRCLKSSGFGFCAFRRAQHAVRGLNLPHVSRPAAAGLSACFLA